MNLAKFPRHKLTFGPRFKALSTGAYLALGWLAVLAFGPLLQHVGKAGVAWLLAGGAVYSLGVIFYVYDEKLRGAHCVWHVFVIGGSVCHAIAVIGYANGAV